MSEAAVAKRRVDRLRRSVRRLIVAAILLSIAWFVYKYDIETIPEGYHHLAPQHMPAGAKVVMTDYDEDTVIGVGSVVLYAPPGHDDKRCFGVVVGLPMERVRVIESGDGRGTLEVAERREELELPEGHKLRSGVIPAGHYLVLNGDRHLFTKSLQPDSRVLGYISQDRLVSKVVTPLYFFQ